MNFEGETSVFIEYNNEIPREKGENMVKYKKCPLCELNYIVETEKLCPTCRKQNAAISSNLVRDKECGTNSRNIYEEYADRYGWNKSQANQFGEEGLPLYAPTCTPEKYSVWCIAHSNWTEDAKGQWENEISYDRNTIEEYWKDHLAVRASDYTIRVVFAKQSTRQYIFLGVYKPDSDIKKVIRDGEIRWVKTYRSISQCYPMKAV